jgi:hypothetical protein
MTVDMYALREVENPNDVRIEGNTLGFVEQVRRRQLGELDGKSGRPLYVLESNLEVILGHSPHGQPPVKIRVPAGFVTDLASVPRALWWFAIPSDPRYIVASIVHDYLYRTGMVPRFLADAVFRTLVDPGVGKKKRWLMWAAVRMAGRKGYRKS